MAAPGAKSPILAPDEVGEIKLLGTKVRPAFHFTLLVGNGGTNRAKRAGPLPSEQAALDNHRNTPCVSRLLSPSRIPNSLLRSYSLLLLLGRDHFSIQHTMLVSHQKVQLPRWSSSYSVNFECWGPEDRFPDK